jgi:tetratricopeptide (TPR) repeat protein
MGNAMRFRRPVLALVAVLACTPISAAQEDGSGLRAKEAALYFDRAEVLFTAGKVEEAAASLREVLRLRPGWDEPDDAQARYNLGLVSLDLRLKSEALKQHRKLTALDGSLARKLYREIYKDKILDVIAGPR